MRIRFFLCTLAAMILAGPFSARAEDWPAYRHDNRRSAVTAENLPVPDLGERWVFRSPHPPRPAWSGPAKWDAYAKVYGLRSMRNFDPVFHVIAQGDALYFPSSVEDCLYCLDGTTGRERWIFTTDGPVRIAPAFHDGKIYFGSDDGHAYCVKAESGELVWRYKPSGPETLLLNNGKFISHWPVRTGVTVENGRAFFGASLLPWKESFLCAVDGETGSVEGPGCYRQVLRDKTLEGALLASPTKLYMPQGRVPPVVFDLESGALLGSLSNGGGVFALLTPDSRFLHGPGNKDGWITESSAEGRDKIAQYDHGNSMVVAGAISYLLTDTFLAAFHRTTRKTAWKVECAFPYTLILAGEALIAGGNGRVGAFSAKDGASLWSAEVDGKAFGLAAANGALYVSTDTGAIHCFRAD